MIDKKEMCATQKVKLEMQMPPEKFKALLFLMDKFATHRDAVLAVINEKMKGALNMDQKKNLVEMLERASIRKEEVESKQYRNVQISRIMPLVVFGIGILTQTQGFCNDLWSALSTTTDNVLVFVFSMGIKKIILILAGAGGMYKSIASGSFEPILKWGACGILLAFIPALIDIFSKLG